MYLFNTQEDKLSLNFLSFLMLLCGVCINVTINVVGELYLSELIATILAISLIIKYGDQGLFNNTLFKVVIGLGFSSLAGYMISDVVAGTSPDQYLKGWARIIMLIVNCITIMVIANHGKQYLLWIIIGGAIGGILKGILTGLPITATFNWKMVYGSPIGILTIIAMSLINMRLASLAIATLGTFSILFDSRTMGAIFIVVSAIVWTKAKETRSGEKAINFSLYIKLMVFGLVGALIIYTAMLASQADYKERRENSNAGRLAGIVVSIKAVIHSPLIGYGSWTKNEFFENELRKTSISQLDANKQANIMQKGIAYGDTFRAHSQVLQTWVEAGIFGVLFFIYYGFLLIKNINWIILHRVIDKYTPIFTFYLMSSLWAWAASPFGGDTRIKIAISLGIILTMIQEQKKITMNSIEQQPNLAVNEPEKNNRKVAYNVLQRKKV